MTTTITITDVNAVLGIIFGLSGLFLGLFSYLRDKPKVKVHLQWGMQIHGDPNRDSEKEIGIVTVANVGRRPIYLSHVALKLPRNFSWRYMVLCEGITGNRLAEGDPPKTFTVDHDEIITKLGEEFNNCPNVWKKIRAQVSDSAGKHYYSGKIKEEPSWSWVLKSNLALKPDAQKPRAG